MYKGDKLRKYIEKSVLKIVNEDFRIRLPKELVEKYESGSYANSINK